MATNSSLYFFSLVFVNIWPHWKSGRVADRACLKTGSPQRARGSNPYPPNVMKLVRKRATKQFESTE